MILFYRMFLWCQKFAFFSFLNRCISLLSISAQVRNLTRLTLSHNKITSKYLGWEVFQFVCQICHCIPLLGGIHSSNSSHLFTKNSFAIIVRSSFSVLVKSHNTLFTDLPSSFEILLIYMLSWFDIKCLCLYVW